MHVLSQVWYFQDVEREIQECRFFVITILLFTFRYIEFQEVFSCPMME